ncbi:Maf family nucleotide pyrophosphatase [Capnocytophaga catalasegens]|uniref:dTTP/UTP pyrophosphatase n=1 Tax=Capnocytophaga catalasegens TaxID=1004260 RepID=A0AAV5AY78_9FLAO|nr:Maf family nucleotide pyrophosphatase [Capnocytophaga catalasegens]GIZ14740.1 Maf-like protein [Capnocytophaga catalasegens]GJM50588.1 Maf-like protein [Capnocytophaga catalasegens]GJM53581.1 Maf-like protein [Capnocytophaga catalasegens]
MISLYEKLAHFNIILATLSPRRHQFFKDLNIAFESRVKPIDEQYPSELKASQITDYIAQKKATAFYEELTEKDILITSDTLVWIDNQALGKPSNYHQAERLLKWLSGRTHQVITSVCFTTTLSQRTINETTLVTFRELSQEEIDFYLQTYKPYDKAGAYGIQEWIGFVGITRIEGSYNNVVGFPTHRLFNELNRIVEEKMKN